MRKSFLICLMLVLVASVFLAGCSEPTSTPTSAPTSTSISTSTPAPTSTTPAAGQPVRGGTLKVICQNGPSNIGYPPTMNTDDQARSNLYAERLMDLDVNGNLVPCLAKSWEISSDGKAITFKLEENVKFHDGTDFDAAAVKWNVEDENAAGALPGGKNIASIDVIDNHTVRFNLTEYSSEAIYNFWRPLMVSPTAVQANGKDWAAVNAVTTAAYKVVNFQSGSALKLERFDDYWRSDTQYLDGIQFNVVQDSATCSAMIQAGQAHIWVLATPKEASELKSMSFQVLSIPNRCTWLYLDSKNSESPFAKKEVREAVEYAINREAITKALGYGFMVSMNQLAPPDSAGYNSAYAGRPYDVAKAKQLMKDAGYGDGFSTVMDLLPPDQNVGTTVQNYLAEIGINVKLDVADPGRFFDMQFVSGWQGIHLAYAPINAEYGVGFLDMFGPMPLVQFVSMAKSAEFLAAGNQVLQAKDTATMRELTKQMVTVASEDAMAIPLFAGFETTIAVENLHTGYLNKFNADTWHVWEDWLEK